MNAKEITIKNIEANGFRIGKAVKGKGYELYEAPYHFVYGWGILKDDKKKAFILDKISKSNINNLFVKDIWIAADSKKHFQYESKEQAQSQIKLQELIDKKFEGVSEITIYYAPDKLLGYFPITKYKSDINSQAEMIKNLLKFDKKELYKDELFDYEDEWEYDDDIISFNSNGYIGDYSLVHGSGYMEDRYNCKHIDGRLDNYNEMIVDDFWRMDIEECMKTHFEELDPNDKLCVYHRKGKDWHVGHQYESEQIILTYRDDEGEIYEDEFYALYCKKDKELQEKFVKIIASWRDDIDMKSYIYNELEIGGYDNNYYNDSVVNQTLVELIYEDKNDLAIEIVESLQSWELKTIKEEFAKTYYAIIGKAIKVKDDLTIQITTVPCQFSSKPNAPQIKTYNHLKLIKRLEKRYDYELVKTSISGSLDTVQWAIKQGNEEYHFDICDVIARDIDGTQTLREFIVEVLEALEKRRLEKISQAELFEKASRVFIGIADSIQAGNCEYGTNQFIAKHHIDTSKIGGIRGDVLLEMENSSFTKRAVNHAIIAHGGLAS
ncbi:hypothetical protein [Sulfurimonas indica]|uniref:hypothetical protein n=1 Tax=Sulfurimonas TaxID=202746 RepID=UPI001265A328|nr:hypothetical protein [Sulfurimonas indica]